MDASACKCEVYGDTAQFTKENDKFTALLLGFPLWRPKGKIRVWIIFFSIARPSFRAPFPEDLLVLRVEFPSKLRCGSLHALTMCSYTASARILISMRTQCALSTSAPSGR